MKAFLFDLDGTLLPMDIDQFMHLYFQEMSKLFTNLLPKKELVEHVMTATGAMIQDTSDTTNEMVFMKTYEQLIGNDLNEHQALWNIFYDTSYDLVQSSTKQSPQIIKAISLLKEKGYQLIIITNPLFPSKAIQKRVEWAGLSTDDFDYITSFEKNTYCKPQIGIYNEVLSTMNLEPSDCMMVGNDVQEDMIAGHLGIKTYLLKDHLLNRSDDNYQVDHEGFYDDFLAFVKALPLAE